MSAARPQPGHWAPVRIQVGDGSPVHHVGNVCVVDGESSVVAVAQFLRELADQLDPHAPDDASELDDEGDEAP